MLRRKGAALLRSHGFRHTHDGLWHNVAAHKVFTDEYLWRRDETSLRADLTETIAGPLKVYSSWPLAPDARRAVERMMASPEEGDGAPDSVTSFSAGSWDAHRHGAGEPA